MSAADSPVVNLKKARAKFRNVRRNLAEAAQQQWRAEDLVERARELDEAIIQTLRDLGEPDV
jgi:hypothetical protein